MILRGHRMRPIRDGWVLLYDHAEAAPTDELHDELCIVRTADHRTLCRILHRGRRPGTWDLLTAIGDQELDVSLVWAAKVLYVVPHSPAPEVTAALFSAQ